MKVKKILSVLGLGLFAAVSVGAGVALNKGAKAESVKADDPKTWMFTAIFDVGDTESWANEDSYAFRVEGSNIDGSVWHPMHKTGVDQRYAVTLSFTDSQSVNGGQLRFWQGSTEKYSQNLSFTFSKSDAATYGFMRWKFNSNWSGNQFEASNQSNAGLPKITYKSVPTNFVADPESCAWKITGLEVSSEDTWEPFYINYYDNVSTYYLIDSGDYVATGANNWFEFNTAGKYDLIINNSYNGSGTLSLKFYENVKSFIYYFTESADPTPNKIYSFGGSEQFGSWPGKNILDVEGVEDVSGVLHFEGYNQRIYKIPFTIGYPEGDSSFLFNYNGSKDDKTVDYTLEPEMGYYWSTESGDYALAATRALEFLLKVEAKRNASSYKGRSYSICGISAEDAKDICDEYNVIGNTERQYILRTTTKTWNPDYEADDPSNTEIDGVSYAAIMGELSRIAGVDVGLSTRTIPGNNGVAQNVDSTTLIAIISVICLVSIPSVVVLIVVKKRKHQ